MAFKKLKFRIEGLAPVVFHNGMLADPLYEGSKRMREVTAKRKKTDADLEQLARLEFTYSLYVDERSEPIVPSDVLRGCLIAGAKRLREGVQAKAGLYLNANAPLLYDGPRDAKSLFERKEFVFRSIETVNRNKVVRTRPRFERWAAEFEAEVDDELLSERALEEIVRTSGRVIGIGERRPTFGRFTASRVA